MTDDYKVLVTLLSTGIFLKKLNLHKMPVEIRELQITAVVKQGGGDPQGGGESSSSPGGSSSSMNTDAVVSACVEQVLEILKQKNER